MRISPRAMAFAATAVLSIVAAGCASGTNSSQASGGQRTIDVTMTDNAYQPTQIRVAKGETVTLNFKNDGSVTHEAVLGDDATQMRHESEMTPSTGGMTGSMGSMSMSGDSDSVTVEPGMSGQMTHTFTETGTVVIGCHEPGHWAAGMKATISVS